jgi:hypothetical protein
VTSAQRGDAILGVGVDRLDYTKGVEEKSKEALVVNPYNLDHSNRCGNGLAVNAEYAAALSVATIPMAPLVIAFRARCRWVRGSVAVRAAELAHP